MSTEQRIALVTGASRGIGRAIALRLVEAGYSVVGTATTEKSAQDITDYLKAAKNTGKGLTLNLGELDSIKKCLASIQEDFSMTPTILVNNAGITRDNLLMRMKPQEWNDVIQTNLSGVYHLIQGCIRNMIKQRFGRIVNISSVVGVTGNPGQANYCAAKAGLIGLTKSIAREVGSRGITANAVAPGFIETDMTKALNEEQHKQLINQIPLARMGQAEEIADAVSFLVASKAANYITGETLHVNGGMYMG